MLNKIGVILKSEKQLSSEEQARFTNHLRLSNYKINSKTQLPIDEVCLIYHCYSESENSVEAAKKQIQELHVKFQDQLRTVKKVRIQCCYIGYAKNFNDISELIQKLWKPMYNVELTAPYVYSYIFSNINAVDDINYIDSAALTLQDFAEELTFLPNYNNVRPRDVELSSITTELRKEIVFNDTRVVNIPKISINATEYSAIAKAINFDTSKINIQDITECKKNVPMKVRFVMNEIYKDNFKDGMTNYITTINKNQKVIKNK